MVSACDLFSVRHSPRSALVALTQLSKLVPNITIMATASPQKFDVLRAHIHYLFEHDTDYTEDIRKWAVEYLIASTFSSFSR